MFTPETPMPVVDRQGKEYLRTLYVREIIETYGTHDAIEKHLGGKPDRVIINKSNDHVVIKGDKKVRFDINDSGQKNGQPDKPHFHIQKRVSPPGVRPEDWEDVTETHRVYLKE